MRPHCSLCKQFISHQLELKYGICSHCTLNFQQRPESMNIDEWLSQFPQFEHLKK